MNFWHFLIENRQQALELTVEHITMAGVATPARARETTTQEYPTPATGADFLRR